MWKALNGIRHEAYSIWRRQVALACVKCVYSMSPCQFPVPDSLPAMPNVNRAEGGKRQATATTECVCVCGWGRGGDNCTFVARKNYQSCAALPHPALACAIAASAVLININCMHSSNTNMLLPCLCNSSAVLTTSRERQREKERVSERAGTSTHA